MMMVALLWMQQSIHASSDSADSKPNIVFILADDLGWGNVGFHNTNNTEIRTPNIDALAATGLELSRMYVYPMCAPTRSSLQTGRLPVHVTTNNDDGLIDPTHGIPVEMTGIASKLKEANYSTHFVGKWDAGFASYGHLPIHKGYDSFYGYLDKATKYFGSISYNDCPHTGDVDLWEDDLPAAIPEQSHYIEFTFRDKVLQIIEDHDPEQSPLMLIYGSHLPHFPMQIPEEYLRGTFSDDENGCDAGTDEVYPGWNATTDYLPCRTVLNSQVGLLDDFVGQIVEKLKAEGLWNNTLLIFQSDNGADIRLTRSAGNNYPLRGGKTTDFEGGIRAVTVVNGGYLPDSRRGQVEGGMMHIADWYVTWCSMLGINSSDTNATAKGLPDVDGYNMWPLISGQVTDSPRTMVIISNSTLIQGDLKLMTSKQQFDIWQETVWPTSSSWVHWQNWDASSLLDCTAPNHCLFNVSEDISESHNLATELRSKVNLLKTNLDDLAKGFWKNTVSGTDSCPRNYQTLDEEGYFNSQLTEMCGCWMALYNYNGTDGPYQNLPEEYLFFKDEYKGMSGGSRRHNHREHGGEQLRVPGHAQDISSVMRQIKDEMNVLNDIELEWIEQYQGRPNEMAISERVWEETVRRESENRMDAFSQTLDVEHGGDSKVDGGVKVNYAANSASDGGLGAPTVVVIGVAVTTIVCLFAICTLAKCLKNKEDSTMLEADSYGTLEGYIL